MRRLTSVLLVALVAGLALAVVGCGGDSNDDNAYSDTTTTVATTSETDTTATDTTATDTTETDSTSTTALSDIASAENCRELSQLGQSIGAAVGGGTDVAKTKEYLDQLAEKAPEEIRDHFIVIAAYFGKIADALGDYKAGETPDAGALAKLAALGQEDAAKVAAASTAIGAWVSENCVGG